jgi:protein TonB
VAEDAAVEPVQEEKPAARPAPEKPKARTAKKAPPEPAKKKSAAAPSAPSRKSADSAAKTAAPASKEAARGTGVSPARWQSRVNAHLNRHKRFPAGASARGVVTVRFSINASGAVLGVSVVRTSGDAALDAAAIDMVRRASPVPAPPPGIAKSRMNLTVPVRFSRR